MTEAEKVARISASNKAAEAAKRRSLNRLEDVKWLLDQGMHPALVAQEMGFNPRTFRTWCQKNGHHEVAAVFTESAA